MDTKVSIIVPIYNVEKYLQKCIDSLIKQTYANIEIMLVDDGSPDNSGKICDEYSKKDDRIKVIHKENGGYGSVLELAINSINSKFFLICDPDDWLELDAVEKLLKSAEKYNVDFVVGRKKLVYSDGKIESDYEDYKTLKKNYVYNNFIEFLGIPCSPHAKLYKTEICKDVAFPKKVNNTDYLIYQIYLTRISSALFLDEELSNYYIDRPGNSFNEDNKFTEKSLISNSIVTRETYIQLNKDSKIYNYSLMCLFVRSCKYLALMKKNKMNYPEYEKIFTDIIDEAKKQKNNLYPYINSITNAIFKNFIKYIVYKMCFNKKLRNISFSILSNFMKK